MAANRLPGGAYWALTTLLSAYTLEVPLHRLVMEPRLGATLLPATRVCISGSRGRPLGFVTHVAARIAAAELRPVVYVSARDLHDRAAAARTLSALGDAGVREARLVWPPASCLVDVLDDLVRVLSRERLRRRGIRRIAVAGSLDWGLPDYSADLLRAFDAALDAGRENDVDLALLAPRVRTAESVVEWEGALRSTGNRIPIFARSPGVAQDVSCGAVPMLVGLAAAIDEDPECLITGVQLRARRSPARTAEVAREMAKGNFVLERTSAGYQFSPPRVGGS